MDNNLSYQRRCAVSKAWSKERQQVMNSRGSRNWSQKEQKEIIRTGKCHGYEGQHMLSVKKHPEHAGNEKNIQFLTHDEHLKAHRGNWKNDANGKFNLRTGKVEPFSDGNPNIKYRKLSDPISDQSKKIADGRYQNTVNAKNEKPTGAGEITASKGKLPVRKTTTDSMQIKREKSRELFNYKATVSGQGRPAELSFNKRSSQRSNMKSKGKGQELC